MTRTGAAAAARQRTDTVANLVWIDAREAIVLAWRRGTAVTLRLASDVPGHHHSTGHVRHDPTSGGGSAGPPRTAGESHRLEHLARFIDDVATAVPPVGDVLVLGPGTVHERLAELIRAQDARQERTRMVGGEASEPRTERQLVARLRGLAGAPARRRLRSSPPRSATMVRRASGSLGPAPGRWADGTLRRRAESGDASEREPVWEPEDAEALDDAEAFDDALGVGGTVADAGAGPGESGSS